MILHWLLISTIVTSRNITFLQTLIDLYLYLFCGIYSIACLFFTGDCSCQSCKKVSSQRAGNIATSAPFYHGTWYRVFDKCFPNGQIITWQKTNRISCFFFFKHSRLFVVLFSSSYSFLHASFCDQKSSAFAYSFLIYSLLTSM